MSELDSYDVAIVGAGIVGLAHALAAARDGRRVLVIDRDAQANGASIRNFGFVTVTGQEQGTVWRRARRSRDVWMEVAGPAGIAVEHHGLTMVAQRPEARAVCAAFLQTDMAEGCAWHDAEAAQALLGPIHPAALEGVLTSAIDIRVESRTAIPKLAAWLAAHHGVEFWRGVAVHGVETGQLDTSVGTIPARAIIVCPGDDLATLFPDSLAGITRCKLQMLRLADPGYRLPGAIMSDLGMVRYLGYAALPEAAALRQRLEAEQADHLANGIHLIVVQSADGSLVVGDSHHYATTPDPFSKDAVDALILDEFRAVFGHVPPVLERWTGTYASAASHSRVTRPLPGVQVVTVTSGTGASTAFALAEETIAAIAAQPQGAVA
ncbi:FAD dependent oxidoreductase TIGR03364 [Sphingomonas sp. BE270]|jgi:FAD dependent oxidoreductase TIGR03364|nr:MULTISPECIES: TIGR03364 family FAD-dependent oxidoreductase [unclassified Sphingomonas]MDR6847881.1 FAD dependent oxidoreductase TIGR03364 [Sphingomonas sp. BE137]MDR7258439.1 FAD dependent oxidoreductase TIGR03364 [Sphingomonas sp. BE270]